MTSRHPPSKRDAQFVDQRQSRQLQSMSPGALTGRLASAQPVTKLPGSADALFGFDGGNTTQASRASKVDIFTLPSDGPQDLTLTFVPVEDSWNLLHNRLGGVESEHFTLSGQTVSLLSGTHALTGDTVRVQYDYLLEQADPVEDIPALDVPFSSTGWKYVYSNPGAGWEDPDYDDTAWASGQQPIGNTGYATYADDDPNTIVPDPSNPITNEIWVRRKFGPGTNIQFEYRMARYLEVFVDGVHFADYFYGAYHTNAGIDTFIADQSGIWTLALHYYDFSWVGGGPSFDIGCNVQITGDEA